MTDEFQLTEDLITLLRNSYVSRRLSDCETGAAEIDCKRPYGNSYVALDIAELLNWDFDPDEELPEDVEERAMALHAQTPTALQIVLSTGGFVPGLYRQAKEYYDTSWCLAEDVT